MLNRRDRGEAGLATVVGVLVMIAICVVAKLINWVAEVFS
jgi:hypothetical protein